MQEQRLKAGIPPLPTTPQALLNILQEIGVAYQIYDHEPIFRVEDGLHLKKSIPGLHCRNLFLCDKKKTMFLVVAANDTAVDLKKLDSLIGSARLSFGSPERLWKYLGIYPGAVCPFAAINDKNLEVNIILDGFMMKAPVVCYHPLDNAQTIGLTPADLLKFFAHTGHAAKILDLSPAAPT
jgi:Ala-tRNA(Pro) deacylase